jgi:hypothetical protein
MNTKRFSNRKMVLAVGLAVGSLMLAAPAYLAAQDTQGQESVADAARKAQAQRKDAPKAKLTIDNDNLSTLTGVVNVVGEAPATDQANKADDKANPSQGKGEAYWRARFGTANKKLNDDSHELDIMQREYNLKQEQFYTDPMAALKQQYSRSDLNDAKAKIDDMTATVAQDKANISDLEDQLRQAGGDPGWANPTTAQPATSAESAPASESAQPTGAEAPPATSTAPAPATSPTPAPAQ